MAAIDTCIEDWHRHLRGELPGGLDALLADEVVFYSPIVFTPQKGKDVTRLYLAAASSTFGGEAGSGKSAPRVGAAFHYTKELRTHPHAVLEFETEVDGKHVNGVDIITCNEDAKIVEFRVMIRPLQAVNLMHQRMAAMLSRMGSG
jgi:hypothetical protein